MRGPPVLRLRVLNLHLPKQLCAWPDEGTNRKSAKLGLSIYLWAKSTSVEKTKSIRITY